MLAALDLGDKKGNQLRREFPRLINEGKTVPFQEVYSTKARARGNNNNRNKKSRKPKRPTSVTAKLLGGETVDLTKYEDAREPLMAWLRAKDNPYFAKAFVNRVWAGYFKVGIVNPPDDLSLANPPCNKALLDYLAQGFIDHGFDMKWVHREIANSRTYQLTWKPNETNRLDEINFSHQVPRRLPAESAYDATRPRHRLRCDGPQNARRTRRPGDCDSRSRPPQPGRFGLCLDDLRPVDSRIQLRLRPLGRSQPPANGLPAKRPRSAWA